MGAGEAWARSARLYSTTWPASSATQRSPEESKVRPPGASIPLVMTVSGCASPVASGAVQR